MWSVSTPFGKPKTMDSAYPSPSPHIPTTHYAKFLGKRSHMPYSLIWHKPNTKEQNTYGDFFEHVGCQIVHISAWIDKTIYKILHYTVRRLQTIYYNNSWQMHLVVLKYFFFSQIFTHKKHIGASRIIGGPEEDGWFMNFEFKISWTCYLFCKRKNRIKMIMKKKRTK